MMRKVFIHLIYVAAFLGFAVSEASACSCVELPGIPLQTKVREAKTGALAVFSGKVLNVDGNLEGPYLKVWFKVADRWKGSLGPIVEIRTATSSAACGFAFEKGRSYLVYAYGSDSGSSKTALTAGLCTRTAPLPEAKADIKFLGERRKPSKERTVLWIVPPGAPNPKP